MKISSVRLLKRSSISLNWDWISTNDVQNMKKELHQLLRELEILSEKGSFHNGNALSVYLSNVNFEAMYSYRGEGRVSDMFFAGLFDQLDGFARQ